MSWTIEGRHVTAEEGNVLQLVFDVKESLEASGVLVVVLDVPPNEVMTENVFGISRYAMILWQIERIPETATDPVNVYVGLSPDSGDTVMATNWNGIAALVDVRTGKILRTQFTK